MSMDIFRDGALSGKSILVTGGGGGLGKEIATALAAKIDALIDNPAKLEAARDLYRERARHFDFNASIEKLVELYRSVIAAAGSQREIAP